MRAVLTHCGPVRFHHTSLFKAMRESIYHECDKKLCYVAYAAVTPPMQAINAVSFSVQSAPQNENWCSHLLLHVQHIVLSDSLSIHLILPNSFYSI